MSLWYLPPNGEQPHFLLAPPSADPIYSEKGCGFDGVSAPTGAAPSAFHGVSGVSAPLARLRLAVRVKTEVFRTGPETPGHRHQHRGEDRSEFTVAPEDLSDNMNDKDTVKGMSKDITNELS